MRDFLATYAAYISRLARLAVRGAGALDPADVAQEVIVTLLRSHRQGSFDPALLECPEAYLRVVVRNAAQRARARSDRDAELTSEGNIDTTAEFAAPDQSDAPFSPEEATSYACDARRRLEALKQRLRPRDAVAFALLIEDGLSIEEAAVALGTTSNNVYQMRHRILSAAREHALIDEALPPSVSGRRS